MPRLLKRMPSAYRRARPEVRSRGGAPIRSAGFGGSAPVLSGILVTPQSALSLTAAYACINVIATDLASLPLHLCRERKGGGKDILTDDIRSDKLKWRPNAETNSNRFRQHLLGHVLGWGNGFAEIVTDGSGQLQDLWPLSPQNTVPKRPEDGRGPLYYELEPSGQRKLDPSRVLHVAGLGFDGLTGYSPVSMAKQAFGLGIALEEFGASFFGNGAIPRGMLKAPKKLSAVAARNLRESFNNVHQGTKNAHQLAVLEEGVEWVETQIKPDDAQFLTSRHFQVIEVCRIYRVPPQKVCDYSQSHLANLEESNQDYIDTTLLGWAIAIEAELNLKLLTEVERRKGYCWEHDFSRMQRGNLAARTASYTAMRDRGVINANEWRTREGMNPIGGDEGTAFLVQSQYIQVADAIKPPAGEADAPGSASPTPDAGMMDGR